MFDTVSLFDALEQDNTQRRVTSRRALALAHNRVEQNLGSFLRGAHSEDEFEERLALLQDDFAGYVTTASREVGHEHPEHIAAALKDHYRLAAKAVEFEETPAEKQKQEEEEDVGKEAHAHWGNIKVLAQPMAGKQGSPLADDPNPYGSFLGPNPNDIPGNNFYNQQGQSGADPIRNQQGYIRPGWPKGVGDVDEGYEQIPYGVNPDPRMQRQHGYGQDVGLEIAPNLPSLEVPPGAPIRQGGVGPGTVSDPWGAADMKGFNAMNPGLQNHTQCPDCGGHMDGTGRCANCGYDELHDPQAGGLSVPGDYPPENGENFGGGWPSGHMAANPAEQRDTSPDTVTCPECGGDGKTAGATKCAKCGGKGKVRNFGDSATDFYGADIKTSAEEQNNTGLDGPEPKMNKGQGPGSMPDVPGNFVKKDVVEPIKATNEDSLSEIDGSEATHNKSERESLPSEKENAGFQTGGEDSGPHTKTFGDGGQANPVTHETISSHNPLSDLLTSAFPPDQVVNEALLSLPE